MKPSQFITSFVVVAWWRPISELSWLLAREHFVYVELGLAKHRLLCCGDAQGESENLRRFILFEHRLSRLNFMGGVIERLYDPLFDEHEERDTDRDLRKRSSALGLRVEHLSKHTSQLDRVWFLLLCCLGTFFFWVLSRTGTWSSSQSLSGLLEFLLFVALLVADLVERPGGGHQCAAAAVVLLVLIGLRDLDFWTGIVLLALPDFLGLILLRELLELLKQLFDISFSLLNMEEVPILTRFFVLFSKSFIKNRQMLCSYKSAFKIY
jgi:hypothetical protein